MVELDQLKLDLQAYETQLAEVKESLDLDNKTKRIEELDRLMEMPDFWLDAEKAQRLSKESKSLKDDVETYHHLYSQYEDINTFLARSLDCLLCTTFMVLTISNDNNGTSYSLLLCKTAC